MKCVIATLFEHDYHLGVAVLVNSLCESGFAGTIYAGFRGPLPPWAQKQARAVDERRWEMTVTPAVRIVFMALDTPAHFTNYKPDFLFRVETLAGAESEAVIYCDPDLVVNTKWKFIEEWISCGVALCEDVNSPFGSNHPRRVGWRRFFQPRGFDLRFRGPDYANGGFIGLRWEHRKLLVTWQTFMTEVTRFLGGTDVVGIEGGKTLITDYGFADCFRHTDQDVLNAVLEACPEIPVSFLGPQTMGFVPGRARLPHALGPLKPWRRRYVREALGGRPPNAVDKAFWKRTERPIEVFPPAHVSQRRFQLAVGAALGRFIHRN
jgi:hypothetical protein